MEQQTYFGTVQNSMFQNLYMLVAVWYMEILQMVKKKAQKQSQKIFMVKQNLQEKDSLNFS